jgi:hypothetical protein
VPASPSMKTLGAIVAALKPLRDNNRSQKQKGHPDGYPFRMRIWVRGYRFENWKLRRALARPYFLRSTTRLSRVRKPPALSAGRSPGS